MKVRNAESKILSNSQITTCKENEKLQIGSAREKCMCNKKILHVLLFEEGN